MPADLTTDEMKAMVKQTTKLANNLNHSNPTLSLICSLALPEAATVVHSALLPGARFLLTAQHGGTFAVWDLTTPEPVATSQPPPFPRRRSIRTQTNSADGMDVEMGPESDCDMHPEYDTNRSRDELRRPRCVAAWETKAEYVEFAYDLVPDGVLVALMVAVQVGQNPPVLKRDMYVVRIDLPTPTQLAPVPPGRYPNPPNPPSPFYPSFSSNPPLAGHHHGLRFLAHSPLRQPVFISTTFINAAGHAGILGDIPDTMVVFVLLFDPNVPLASAPSLSSLPSPEHPIRCASSLIHCGFKIAPGMRYTALSTSTHVVLYAESTLKTVSRRIEVQSLRRRWAASTIPITAPVQCIDLGIKVLGTPRSRDFVGSPGTEGASLFNTVRAMLRRANPKWLLKDSSTTSGEGADTKVRRRRGLCVRPARKKGVPETVCALGLSVDVEDKRTDIFRGIVLGAQDVAPDSEEEPEDSGGDEDLEVSPSFKHSAQLAPGSILSTQADSYSMPTPSQSSLLEPTQTEASSPSSPSSPVLPLRRPFRRVCRVRYKRTIFPAHVNYAHELAGMGSFGRYAAWIEGDGVPEEVNWEKESLRVVVAPLTRETGAEEYPDLANKDLDKAETAIRQTAGLSARVLNVPSALQPKLNMASCLAFEDAAGVLALSMLEGQATYSGVPVYEMMCKSVAVMRRRSDSWLNATQILKVAGLDKPQRTRVLEREVQKGEHEKVQGGYGKYQGTWVPLDRGLHLAQQYHVETLLRAIIDFTPAASSPPLAPKHLTAAPARLRQKESPEPPKEPKPVVDVAEGNLPRGSEDGSLTDSPSEVSEPSRTPSPLLVEVGPSARNGHNGHLRSGSGLEIHSNPVKPHSQTYSQPALFNAGDPRNENSTGPRYADIMLEYFISDTNQIPSVLVSPPSDFEPDVPIDDDGHTALHWACAMGRIRVVKLLLSAGADIFKENKSGQTPLMRSVMFANNYDVRKFPELYELLHRSTLNVDNYNRTVFHHIVDVAMSKGKAHAARYYMETLLSRLSDFPDELADVINFQDDDGETALTMAARCRSKRLVKILLDHGADPKIANRDGKTTEDYIFEDERFRMSPTIAPAAPQAPLELTPQLHYSKTAQRTTTKATAEATSLMASLAAAFDAELVSKERDLAQAHALLTNIQGEILESQRAVNVLKAQGQGLEEAERELKDLEEELGVKMGARYRLGWEKWLRDEEARDKAWKAEQAQSSSQAQLPNSTSSEHAPLPTLTIDLAELYAPPPKGTSITEACDALRSEIGKLRTRRHELFDEFVRQQADSGTSGRMAEYRRLISAAAGGVPMQEVDSVVPMLLEQLESEEATLNVAWASQTQGATRPSNTASNIGVGRGTS
ncbi:Cell division cycle-related protein res2/pct1 [Rhizoctonia solani AG-1 IB]|uniref:Cell division cycle-related protein res2/pct1 n=1 Tax=Thanatephorus cucumeris (strain AG1-IB / isolate 7/3/14) TaxID=1108050 RepID=M5C2D8_THACB|nr:Cell division cycle-related protein res2/pct1 [Rhizoctonia solani AG-1 IB]